MLRWMGRHAGRREGSSERLRSARRGQKRAELSRNYRQSTINVPSTRRGARGLHTHLWLRMLNGMRGRQGFSMCAEVDASSTVQGTAQCRREIFRGIVPSVIRSESDRGVLGYINVTNSQCSFIWVCPANLSMKSCKSVCQLEVRASEQIRDENTVSS